VTTVALGLSLLAALATATIHPPPAWASSTTTGASSSTTSPSTSTSTTFSSTTAGPSTSAAAPGSAQISATEAQVATVEAQIAQEQATLDQADENYNQATVDLAGTRASLQSTGAALTADKAELVADRVRLRNDAIGAYTSDATSGSISELFAGPGQASEERSTYDRVAVGDVVRAADAVQAGQEHLAGTQARLLAEQQTETAQLTTESQAQQAASAAASQSQATLDQVKGTLAQQIAQQAAAQAAAAAAAAAAAKTQAAAQAAAAQAAQAAAVASTVGAGSASATTATQAANQAAGSAGDAGIASGGSPDAAGLAAVHGAMKYLGVPYVWGGASSAGVDCSGLVMLAWAQAGVTLDHSAADQYAESAHVSLTSLEPGDLLFYDLDGTGIDHVVMYVGPTLDGQPTEFGVDTIIQAAHTGTVVSFDPFWSSGLVGAGRP